MIYEKEDIYSWFKTLDGSKRIQFLHGILHLCLPLELRFIGTCIEDLARKDFNYLLDAEVKANTLAEVSTIEDISDRVQRSKLIVTLALLYSSNHDCARKIFELIKCDSLGFITNDKNEFDDKIADEYLLVLTMAANHPAFEFIMKTVISNQLKLVENKLYNDKATTPGQPEPISEVINNKNDTENDYTSVGDVTLTTSSAPLTIKSVNFEGVHFIEGTNSYEFMIKVCDCLLLLPLS